MNNEIASNEKKDLNLTKRVYESLYQIIADRYKLNLKFEEKDENGITNVFEIKCTTAKERDLLANQS